MRIALASDHAGYDLRLAVAQHLAARGLTVDDLGPAEKARCDYPDYAAQVAGAVASGAADLGILCCGTGVGMSMAANKVHGIRAAVVSDAFSARATRQHNNANILCLGERVVGAGAALLIVDSFLDAEFEGGRHAGRVQKIMDLEG